MKDNTKTDATRTYWLLLALQVVGAGIIVSEGVPMYRSFLPGRDIAPVDADLLAVVLFAVLLLQVPYWIATLKVFPQVAIPKSLLGAHLAFFVARLNFILASSLFVHPPAEPLEFQQKQKIANSTANRVSARHQINSMSARRTRAGIPHPGVLRTPTLPLQGRVKESSRARLSLHSHVEQRRDRLALFVVGDALAGRHRVAAPPVTSERTLPSPSSLQPGARQARPGWGREKGGCAGSGANYAALGFGAVALAMRSARTPG